MKCTNCGAECTGKFCEYCGTNLTEIRSEESALSNQRPNSTSNLQSTAVKNNKPIHTKWWFWAIIFVVFFALGSLSNEKKPSSKPNNAITANSTAKNSEPVTKKESKKQDLSNVAKEYTLTVGHYTAGIDFPAGKCNVTALSGTGNLISSNMYSGGVNEMFGIDDGKGFYTSSFSGLKLPENTTLSLNNRLTVKLEFISIDSNFTGRNYDDNSAITLKNGNYEASIDFPDGTYKIVAVTGTGNLSTSNLYSGGVNEMFGIDDGKGFFNNKFLNAKLDKGTILEVSGGLTIKLVPAK